MELGSQSLPSGAYPINGGEKLGLWKGKIPAAESGLRVEKISHRSVLEGLKGVCVAVSEWRKCHLGTMRQY